MLDAAFEPKVMMQRLLLAAVALLRLFPFRAGPFEISRFLRLNGVFSCRLSENC